MATACPPLRLLILTDTAILGPGGSERFLRNLLTRLPSEEYSIDVLQLAAEPKREGQLAQMERRATRMMYHPIGAIYAPAGIAAFRSVRRRVVCGEYDIVQSHHEKSDLINALLPHGRVPRISNRRDMGFQKSRRVRALFRRANSRFDRIVAPSRAILDALVADENVRSARCLAIPNGVDTGRFHPADARTRLQRRSVLGFADGECLIGCVASFTPVKQHVDLIAAFAQVHRVHPHSRLILVGAGPLQAEIQAQACALGIAGSVRFLGARADIEHILPALDIFVLASSTEGMSNAILEAQACGVVVVATNVGGNAELVQQDKTGVLVPALQPGNLARAIGDLVAAQDRRETLAQAARTRVASEYSLDTMAAAYMRLYRELTSER